MKRFLCGILTVCLFLSSIACFAEEQDDGSKGGFFNKFFSDAGDALNNVVNDAGDFLNDTGDSIGGFFSNVGQAVGDFWGNTADSVKDTWNWAGAFIQEKGSAISGYAAQSLNDLKSFINTTGNNATGALKSTFIAVVMKLGMATGSATRLWDSIHNYADKHNINIAVIAKLTVAIIIRLHFSDESKLATVAEEYIEEIVLGWFNNFNIDNEEAAESALKDLENSLETLP